MELGGAGQRGLGRPDVKTSLEDKVVVIELGYSGTICDSATSWNTFHICPEW